MSYDAGQHTTVELLADWAAVMRELRRRGVIRTNNNPVGDIAEAIVHAHYGGTRAGFSQAGWDVTTDDGERIQVKAMRLTPTTKLAFRTSRSLFLPPPFGVPGELE